MIAELYSSAYLFEGLVVRELFELSLFPCYVGRVVGGH